MTTEEIKEGNKLIAEFEGYEVKYFSENEKEVVFHNGIPLYNLFDCIYHKSFDRLMPVVEKIEATGKDQYYEFIFKIWGNQAQVVYNRVGNGISLNASGNSTKIFIGENKIHAVYTVVIDFIKWYNKQQKA